MAALVAAEDAGRPYDLSSVQRVVSTGATFSADSKRGLTSRQPMAILDMIGASEGGPYAISMTLPGQDPGETAVFTATPNTVLFDDVTWERLPPGSGRTGVLAVTGVDAASATTRTTAKTAATFREIGGVRYTVPGDYAQIDADGTVHLLGRGSVCINTGGEKVYPEEVEEAARTHPGVADCNAIGIPDARFGEAVALVVARAPGQPAVTESEVIAAVRERLAGVQGAQGRRVRGRDRAQPGRQGGLPLGPQRRGERGVRPGLIGRSRRRVRSRRRAARRGGAGRRPAPRAGGHPGTGSTGRRRRPRRPGPARHPPARPA